MKHSSFYKFQIKMRLIILLLCFCANFANSRYLLVNLKEPRKDASSSMPRPNIELGYIPFSDRIEAGKILNILATALLNIMKLIQTITLQ